MFMIFLYLVPLQRSGCCGRFLRPCGRFEPKVSCCVRYNMYHTKAQVLPFQKYPVDRHRQSFLEPFHNGAKKGSFLGPCGRTMRLKKVLCCIFYMCIPKLISSHCSRDILFTHRQTHTHTDDQWPKPTFLVS
uniref:Secreted protein n=1 Tax=Cacopsylla melanoneura TaxID=428564 RepID=A0A8D8PMR8_9HEMI